MNARYRVQALFLASALLAVSAPPLAAQDASAGWNAWFGCWAPVTSPIDAFADTPDRPSLCVVPGSDGSVEMLTVEDGVVTGREAVATAGPPRSIDREGCVGTEETSWSADGRRLFQRSDLTCPGELERESSGIFALDTRGEWISAEAVTVAGETDVRVIRYRADAGVARSIAAVDGALANRGLTIDAARTAARGQVEIADVVEATRVVDVAAVEAWLIEQEQGFEVDGARLKELDEAGVPDRVIDLMIALSYPRVFAIDRGSREGSMRDDGRGRGRSPRGGAGPWFYPMYGRGYYPGYYGGWYGRPVIIVRDEGDRDVDRGGRAVSGRGYTRGGSGGGGGTGSPSTPGSSVGRSGDAGGGGSDRSDTGRTAQPRGG